MGTTHSARFGADHDLSYPANYPPVMKTIEERLEHGVHEWPERFIGHRDAGGQLVIVEDADSGVWWRRFQDGWIWIA